MKPEQNGVKTSGGIYNDDVTTSYRYSHTASDIRENILTL